jgi:dihydroorotate dehydrogenase
MIYRMLKPLIFRLDPERAHDLTCAALALVWRIPAAASVLRALFSADDPILATNCAGLSFRNPIGLAAGFDKRAMLIGPLGALGFGHVEVGTVTPRPQSGNPRPRMFRLPEDEALINRLGFNSPGMIMAARHLRRFREQTGKSRNHSSSTVSTIVGVNIGKNRDTPIDRAVEDYLAAFVALAPLADYVAVNISSPNTPGLRKLHERAALEELVVALAEANRRLHQPRPLFLKLSPDETEAQIETVVDVGMAAGLSGFIATNTTLAREGLGGMHAGEMGGLSGVPLAAKARATIERIVAQTHGRIPLIAVGGIADAEEAYARIRAGASLVQIYTSLVYRGPGAPSMIMRDLAALLRRDGFVNVAAAVGVQRN